MSNDASDNNFLHFEDPEEISSSGTTTIDDANTENVETDHLRPEDFANLARQASGYHSDSNSSDPDSQSNQDRTHQQSKEEEELNSLLDEEIQKVGLRGPYFKIIVGIVLTSAVVIGLVLLRGGWLRIMNLSRNPDTTPKKLSVAPQKQELDRLKAELALMAQSRKPIKPKPALAPKPKPEPAPEAAPEPEPEPIDPYEQWELLSKLGTLGNSAIDIKDTASAKIPRTMQNQPVQPSSAVSLNDRIFNQESPPDNLEASRIGNRVKSVSLRDNLGITNTSVPKQAGLSLSAGGEPPLNGNDNFPQQSSAALQSRFSPDAQRIILSGLGVASSSLKPGNRHTDRVNRRSRRLTSLNSNSSNLGQIAIASSIKGILATSIAWTDSSNPENTRGSITLTEPLNYENGDIALRAGSSIIVEVADFERVGFVNLRALAILATNSKGEVIQQEIPDDSLLIRGEDNQPLKFETANSDNRDSGINQLLGNIVKGSSRSLPIPRQVSSSVSRAIFNGSRSPGENRGKFYFVEAQTPVSVYVNNSIIIEP